MILGVAISVLIVSLLGCMILDLDLIYGLLVGMFAFMTAAYHMGFSLRNILKMMFTGVRESFIVVSAIIIIGAMTGVWRSSGTIQMLIIYGTEMIHPKLFLLFAFLLPAVISYMIGTCYGAAGSIGLVIMMLCKGCGADPLLTAGAVMSGIYFGNRASPASSCALLNSYLTHTDLYRNVRIMIKDCIPATLITIGLYSILSILNPMGSMDIHLVESIRTGYCLTPLLLIPPVFILIAPLIKMKIHISMAVSVLSASILAVTVQNISFSELIRTIFLGYNAEGALGTILNGGGIKSMAHSCLMIIVSATFSGIFNQTQMMTLVEEPLERFSKKMSVFHMTALTCIPIITFSCTQTLSLMLHIPLIRPVYQKKGISDEQMMLDVSNSTVLFSPLIPWCIASSTPLAMFGGSSACLPLAFYLYVPALVSLFRNLKWKKAKI